MEVHSVMSTLSERINHHHHHHHPHQYSQCVVTSYSRSKSHSSLLTIPSFRKIAKFSENSSALMFRSLPVLNTSCF